VAAAEPVTPTAARRRDTPVLDASDIAVSFGGVRAVDGVSVQVRGGEILGLVGPNGSGKSTFLNAVTGIVSASGRLAVAGRSRPLGRIGASRDGGLLRAFQAPQVYANLTCSENVCVADPDRHLTGLGAAWLARRPMLRRERARWARAQAALERVGLGDVADRPAGELAYGQQRMLELARVIGGDPAVVLLDEPSAGLNAAETDVLAGHLRWLRDSGVALIVVDHKIDFIAGVCDRVAVLELGRLIAVGAPHEVFADARVIDAYLGVPRGRV
jgi:ABC-type branched-subunit amino acid transport system ATPase component